ncbi:bifunctional sugar-1-phosphate nucleotidylyltransferase/acetyltransferase [Halobacterium salinarum]|uniref:bifunctional sugar-1-phosphate nucleotidylyltransferase/acetyltransferase n=1 Tax=Halobacterium salinarum TaxID=2242 RepID=UPI002555DF30|nr:bifunctional sugar-1-phosphate nucleotidylyltransferase/acetyltransferase [Halobacterium salinarum]MDL0121137.1 sugar phosphate nucleotidyltransferase [Halobacterium salinarum]
MQAVVLAAGKGERLWPLTENRPKPMVPVANQPILEHIVDALVSAGVTRVVLVVGSNRERVQRHFEDGSRWGIEISYVVQDRQLGTGHALAQAESVVGESFVALNGDRVIDASLVEDVWECHRESGDPAMGVTQVETPSAYGVVDLDGGAVAGIDEQPVPELVASEYINAGVYAFDPSVFAAIRRTDSYGELALTDALDEQLADHELRAVRYDGRWLDVSEPWDLVAANSALITDRRFDPPVERRKPRGSVPGDDQQAPVGGGTVCGEGVIVHPQAVVRNGVALGDNVTVGANAVIEQSILLPDSTVNPGAVVNDSIVGANATIGANTTVEGGQTDVVLGDTVHQGVRFGALVGDNAEVGSGVTVAPGSIVGNSAVVDSATVVTGRVDDQAHVTRG